MSVQPIASVAPAPAPIMRSDMRPTADTAALIRDPQPDIPLPIPASTSQKSTVTQAQITAPPVDVSAVQRVLKPYGVVMLPQDTAQQPKAKADAPGTDDPATDIAADMAVDTAPQQQAAAPAEDMADATPAAAPSEDDIPAPETDMAQG